MVKPAPHFWSGRRVFITGYSGFKGAWLWTWLRKLGAVTTGLALEPESEPSLWKEIGADEPNAWIGDIRDAELLIKLLKAAEPEVVLHLAAQSLVRRSYRDPIGTITTNVVGTMNLLEAVRHTPTVKSVISVTTDKVYQNREWVWPYREHDPLGGHDPYSGSKACAEIVTSVWRQSFLADSGIRVATARAGNVIGGGDRAVDRLIPDCIDALSRGQIIEVRNPHATRPWQHVLEPLSGYLLLAERLHQQDGSTFADAWNFGPDISNVRPVGWVVDHVVRTWGCGASWRKSQEVGPHEAGLLAVDSAKARSLLGWAPKLGLNEALEWTVDWARRHIAGEGAKELMLQQIQAYEAVDLTHRGDN